MAIEKLSKENFLKLVELGPLISIDLVVNDEQCRILVGERVNQPARGYWFVPGGCILKGETLEVAFRRLTECELGKVFEINHDRRGRS
jgi:colanic acid biosynthesis protein WcaH